MSGDDPASVAGVFGSHPLYKNLGYFSLIGLLRLHCQLGDYHTALRSVENIHLSKKVEKLITFIYCTAAIRFLPLLESLPVKLLSITT